MVENNTRACYPELPPGGRMTAAAKLRAATQHGPRRSPSGVLTLLARELGQAFREVAICGGHRYVRVAASWLPDFRTMRQLTADAPVTVINDQIGAMRSQLRAWVTR